MWSKDLKEGRSSFHSRRRWGRRKTGESLRNIAHICHFGTRSGPSCMPQSTLQGRQLWFFQKVVAHGRAITTSIMKVLGDLTCTIRLNISNEAIVILSR